MATLDGTSGRTFAPLPVDPTRGFPQSFPVLVADRAYLFRVYVNLPFGAADIDAVLDLPTETACLVVQIEREVGDGTRVLVFARKVVPGLEYEADRIAFRFPRQRVAARNLNGQGEFGSRVDGGVAPRWA